MQIAFRAASRGLILLLGLLPPWRTPTALAQDSPQVIEHERLKPNEAGRALPATDYGKAKPPSSDETTENKLGSQLFKNIARDQLDIWTSPAHLRLGYADWLVPFAGITAGLLVTDRDVNLHQSNSPGTLKNYRSLSNIGIAGMAGATGGLYLWGRITDDPHKREAGILSGEAALDGLLVSTAAKYATGRERPGVDSFNGRFWQGGDSFPSNHAVAAWAVASVLTHEYPGPLTKFLAYGAASAISIARVRGQKHFPSEVLVGSGIGWLSGWQVYRAHHHSEVGGGTAGDLSDSPLVATDRGPSAMGSPYVPLGSWIYPLLDRLVAMGAISDAILGMKPWTRLECARLVNEAADQLQESGNGSHASRLYESLLQEFTPEINLLAGGDNRAFRLESVYTRLTEISGPPLTDGYHFGQTLFDDFGRPYQEGLNSVAGFSGWATAGRWVIYTRGEYQHAPSGPAIPVAAENAIAAVDAIPAITPSPTAARNQARLLDAYVGLNLGNWQLSYGQESQWWGPGESGPLLFSDNAPPVQMFHIDRVSPFHLPWILRFLGPMRWNGYFGRLQGHILSPNPFFHGEKISFKPTRNLEFGFTRTVVVGGEGRPLTPYRLFLTYFSATSYQVKPANKDPGKRDGGFDFSYRLPFVRNWVTIYNDSISADDPSPLAAPRRAGISPGLYLTHFPGVAKLDLRVEAPLTNTVGTDGPGRYIYWDNYYRDLYTNRKVLMGDWVGRGSGIQATSRYWLSARNSLQFGYRHVKVDPKFIPRGGTINDASVRAEFQLGRDWSASALVQYEQWLFPLLASGLQKNVTTSVQFVYWPEAHKH
jgi:hypothetical protein